MAETKNLVAINSIEYTNPSTNKRDLADSGKPFSCDATVAKGLLKSKAARELTDAEDALFEKQSKSVKAAATTPKVKAKAGTTKAAATPKAKAKDGAEGASEGVGEGDNKDNGI